MTSLTRPLPWRRSGDAFRIPALAWLAAVVLLLTTVVVFAPRADAAQHPSGVVTTQDGGMCVAGENAQAIRSRQVNLVLDDSGSMFTASLEGESRDRWSAAKYSLEVFAAMLAKDDTMSVYLMSDFAPDGTARPALQLSGTQPLSDRVSKVHQMQLAGGGTPYAPVESAVADLAARTAAEKWLVVLTDGAFDDDKVREPSDLQRDLEGIVAANTSPEVPFNIAFLALGESAPNLSNNPNGGVFFNKAPTSNDLLGVMTGFANQIFGRSALPQTPSSAGKAEVDIALDEVMVFAQGADVKIGDLHTANGPKSPVSSVVVQWAPNRDIPYGRGSVKPVPNESLKGTLAVYENVTAGSLTADVTGAQTVHMFYRPKVAFGVKLRDADGNEINADKAVGGVYTVSYGFMDDNCEFVDSPLFGDPVFTAKVMQDGEVIADSLTSGDQIEFERGTVTMDVRASYLDDATSQQQITLRVLQPGKPTAFEVEPREYYVSKLPSYGMPDDAIKLNYFVSENGVRTEFTTEEWAAIGNASFTVTSPLENIEFDVQRGQNIGEVFVLPKAPDGDVYAAATGDVPFTIFASFVFDEQPSTGQLDTTVTIIDDIPFLDRLLHWFLDIGWKLLLALLLLLWILGYFFRRRLPRKLQAKPLVTFRPKSPSSKRAEFTGIYEKSRLRMLIPYLPETGTITPPSQMRRLSPLKIKAAGSGRIEVLNWRANAQSGDVTFDSQTLTKDTKQIKHLKAQSKIVVRDSKGSYEMQLNQSKSNSRGRKRR